ncbi:DUF732 domain-containing protein [Mycobacterium antarcticum]|uniref:DUF732 domain-containing protein n=1 Tax=Mycolicibacterium sp. TUM20984 TaxID=3023368 RepID=UPI00239CB6F1|nr:DUF732 domain-containing protein [Mycolicibacterium sp. TUM20984]GLP80847.1 hypothetical protein TUM20984_22670 [Mycolicibacterium sp. TUM20984]
MKKALLPLIAATFAMGLATAGFAHADEDGFFVDLTDYGYGDTSTDTALKLGYAICEDVQNGVPQQATLDAIYENTGDAVDVADAKFLYKAAIVNLC